MQAVNAIGHVDTYLVSKSYAKYDPLTGLLLSTTEPAAYETVRIYDPVKGFRWITREALGVETDYTYAPAGNGLPAGLIATVTRQSPYGNPVTVARNVYYTNSDLSLAGAMPGQLRYSLDAAGQETYYAYDAAGNTVLNYTLKTWTQDDGSSITGWVGTNTDYDPNVFGRVLRTYQEVYAANGYLFPDGSHRMGTRLDANGLLQVDEYRYYGFNNGNPLLTGLTTYNDDGSVAASIDQYGRSTTDKYDINGRVLATLYPDNTETRTVYDASGR